VSNPFSISFNADSNAPNPAENVVVSENGFFIEGDAVPNGYVRIVNTQSNAIGSGTWMSLDTLIFSYIYLRQW
jgi:hypothetical protein